MKEHIWQKGIAALVQRARKKYNLTQGEMAKKLAMSQSRLCDLERGRASLSAEQLLMFLQEFSISLAELVPEYLDDPIESLRLSLARWGRFALKSSPRPLLISEKLSDLHDVIRETLVITPVRDYLCALAPIIVRHAAVINFDRVGMQLYDLGIDARLWWVVEGTLWAVRERKNYYLPGEIAKMYQNANHVLTRKSKSANSFFSLRRAYPIDVLENQAVGARVLEKIRLTQDALATRWRLITRIQSEDFTKALQKFEEGEPLLE